MRHVVIKYPDTDKIMMEGYVNETNDKCGLWLYYNNEGHILYRINYDENGKLEGPQYCGPADLYNEYNYDSNEMTENIGYTENRRHYEFDVISDQVKKNKIHKELPAIGEYFIMSLENDTINTGSSTGFISLYMPIVVKNFSRKPEQKHIFLPENNPEYFIKGIIGLNILTEDVERIWSECGSEAKFDEKFLLFLDLKNKINNNNLLFDNVTDNIKDLIINKIQGTRKQFLELELDDITIEGSFGWYTGKPKSLNSPTVIVNNCMVNDMMFNSELEKLWNIPTDISSRFTNSSLYTSTVIDTYGYTNLYGNQKLYEAQYRDPSHPEAVKVVNSFQINCLYSTGDAYYISDVYLPYYYTEWYMQEYDMDDNLIREFKDRTNIGSIRDAYYGYRITSDGTNDIKKVGFYLNGNTYNTLKWMLPIKIRQDRRYKIKMRWCTALWKSDWHISRPWNFSAFKNLPEDRYNHFLDWSKWATVGPEFTRTENQEDYDRLIKFDPTLAYKQRWMGNVYHDFNYIGNYNYTNRNARNYPYIHIEGKYDSDNYIKFKSKKQEQVEFPKPSLAKPHPAELWPDTSWELITTDLYIEHISSRDYNKTNRDSNDKLKPVSNINFNLTLDPMKCVINGSSLAKKIIAWITDDLGVYYPKYVAIVDHNNRWEIYDAICMLPYNVRSIKKFTLHVIPIYKEGFGQEATKVIDIPVGFKRSTEIKVPDKFKLNSYNINVVSEDDTPVYIWRRTGDYEQYHPYYYDGMFKEYCVDVPEQESLFREGRYKTDINYNNILSTKLDGEDKMYIRGNLVVERNWNNGVLNPTIKLFSKDGASLATVGMKNNNIYNGKINLTVDETWTTSVNFINPLETNDYKSTVPVVGSSYNGVEILTEIENKKA